MPTASNRGPTIALSNPAQIRLQTALRGHKCPPTTCSQALADNSAGLGQVADDDIHQLIGNLILAHVAQLLLDHIQLLIHRLLGLLHQG